MKLSEIEKIQIKCPKDRALKAVKECMGCDHLVQRMVRNSVLRVECSIDFSTHLNLTALYEDIDEIKTD